MRQALKMLCQLLDPDSEVNQESSGMVGAFVSFVIFALLVAAVYGVFFHHHVK